MMRSRGRRHLEKFTRTILVGIEPHTPPRRVERRYGGGVGRGNVETALSGEMAAVASVIGEVEEMNSPVSGDTD